MAKLRQADILIGQGKVVPEICKEIEISQQTYYHWRQKYGGMNPDMIKQLRTLQKENAQQFSHTGSNNYFEFFALRNKTLRKMFDNGIISHSSQSGHVQHIAYFFSASSYHGLSCEATGTKIIRSNADKSNNLLSIEQSKLRQLGQKYSAGLRPYARCASENFVFVTEFVIGLDVFGDEFIEIGDLAVESPYHHFMYTFERLSMTNNLLSVQFLCFPSR